MLPRLKNRNNTILRLALSILTVTLASTALGYTYLAQSKAAAPNIGNGEINTLGARRYSLGGNKAVSPPIPVPQYVPGEVLVTYKDQTSANNTITSITRDAKYADLKQVKVHNSVYIIKSSSAKQIAAYAPRVEYKTDTYIDLATSQIIEKLKSNPNILTAEPNFLRAFSYQPSDPRFGEQWAHNNSNTQNTWDTTLGSAAIGIAVIDSGVDVSHPDLASNSKSGYDFVDIDPNSYTGTPGSSFTLIAGEDYTVRDTDPSDYLGHGTHVAGIAAAKADNTGILGACPNCSIVPLRAGFAINYYGQPVGMLEDDDICAAIYAAADNPDVRIINMSFGGSAYSQTIDAAVQYASAKKKILVASAGNSGNETPTFPASLPNVISVSALSILDDLAYYSNYGNWVDIAAPGGSALIYGQMILSTVPKNGALSDPSGYLRLQGTSMASPYVAGALGLLLSRSPALTPIQAERIILGTSDRITSTQELVFGKGILNTETMIKSPANTISEITSITQNTTAGTLTISGTAKSTNLSTFAKYRIVAYAYSSTANQILCESTTPVNNATLCTNVSMRLIPNDFSIIELQVETTNGAILSDREYFGQKLFEFTSPLPQQNFRIGDTITISTSAEFVPTNNDYSVDWSYEGQTEWFTTGITKSLVGTQLAKLDTSQISSLKTGTLRIRVIKTFAGYTKGFVTKVFVSSDFKSGWPKTYSGSESQCRVWGIADIDYNKQKEIVTACTATVPHLSYYNRIDIYRQNGTKLVSFPLSSSIHINDIGIADLDRDTYQEIIVLGYHYSGVGLTTTLTIYDRTGKVVASREVPTGEGTLAIGNLVGTQQELEIALNVFYNLGGSAATGEGQILVLDNKLQQLNTTQIHYTVRPNIWDGKYNPPRLLIGNTDADMQDEILGINYRGSETSGSTTIEKYHVVSWNTDGTTATGYPKAISGEGLVLFSLAGAYVDSNRHVDYVAYGTNAFGIFLNGTLKKVVQEPISPRLPIAVTDMNNDGKEEVVFSGSLGGVTRSVIYSFGGSLLKEFNLANPPNIQPDGRILLADINNDASTEIFHRDFAVTNEKQFLNIINPYSSSNKLQSQITYALKNEFQSASARQLVIGDLLGNGRLDYIYGTLSCQVLEITGICNKSYAQIFVGESTVKSGNPALIWNSPAHDGWLTGNADAIEATDITTTISVTHPSATTEGQTSLSIVTTNVGGEYAKNISTAIEIPSGITVVKSPATCSAGDSSATFICALSYLYPGRSVSYVFETSSAAGKTVRATTAIDPLQYDYLIGNNTVTTIIPSN